MSHRFREDGSLAYKLLLFIKEFGLVAEGVVPRSKKWAGRDGLPIFVFAAFLNGRKRFPYFREMFRIENLYCLVEFDERQTATLVKGKPLEYSGELCSEEYGRKFTTEKAGFQVLKVHTDGTRSILAIDRKPIAEWFRERFDKLRQAIRRPV